MTIQTIKFNSGQTIAVNTYNTIMANACEVVTSHLSRPNLKDNIFWDFETLTNDRTMNKVDLANEIQSEIVAADGAYLRADFKELDLDDGCAEWFIDMHRQAFGAVRELMSFSGVNVSVVF